MKPLTLDHVTLLPSSGKPQTDWKRLDFTAKLRGRDLDGVDFVMLDADIAGCVDSFMKHSKLTVFQASTLGLCYHNSSQVISVLYEEGTEYFWRLSRLAELVLREVVSTELTKTA